MCSYWWPVVAFARRPPEINNKILSCFAYRSQAGDLEQYSSTRHRSEYMKLTRAMKSNHAAAAFPKLQKLFTANPMEKKEALKLFVLSGCNCEQVEASFSVSRESEVGSEWEEQHLTVAEMMREGFSQRLALLRAK